jgi:hypothetical protein
LADRRGGAGAIERSFAGPLGPNADDAVSTNCWTDLLPFASVPRTFIVGAKFGF